MEIMKFYNFCQQVEAAFNYEKDPNDSTEEVLSDDEERRESARWWP